MWLTETSGRTVVQVAGDLGIGKSTLTRWKPQFKEADSLSGPHDDVRKERTRLRLENKILRQERDLLKNAAAFFANEKKSMIYETIDPKKAETSVHRDRRLFGVRRRGFSRCCPSRRLPPPGAAVKALRRLAAS